MSSEYFFGKRIRTYRMWRRLSQEELSAKIGLDASALSRIEHGGRKVTLEEAVRLSDALRIPLVQLAGVEGVAYIDETHKVVAHCAHQGQQALTELASVFHELECLVAR